MPPVGSPINDCVEALLDSGETGMQVAAYLHGELVVDTTAGHVSSGGEAVDPDTVFWVASAGKVSTATALHLQVERGLLTYDQPIASVWPEFAACGKASATVRDALTHRVGLADLPAGATPELLGDWEWVVERLAATEPAQDPAAHDAYHARTWGYLVGEIVRRADPLGRSFEAFIGDEVLGPVGATDLWHRLPAAEHGRTAVMRGDILAGDMPFHVTEDHEINTAEYRDRIDPSGVWMTARAGARLWSLYAQEGVVGGTRLLSDERVRSFLAPRPSSFPAGGLAGGRSVIGQGGLMVGGAVPDHAEVLGFGPRVLWHPGAGGALGFADLDTGLAGMISHNEFFDERYRSCHPFAPLVRAIYDEVGS